MPKNTFSLWANRFRRDAVKDSMSLLRDHLHLIGQPDEPEKLIDGTIMIMSACCAYLQIDWRSMDDVLDMQAYRPDRDGDSPYSLTFNLFDRAFGRVFAPRDIKCLDLADLHDFPWHDFKMCGYYDCRVARLDNKALSRPEIEEIENAITDDIRFDYSEEEVEILFDRDAVPGVLVVYVIDIM
ncbi:MAG: hypothetical protein WC541_05225 [Dehalococcoidia bacterium]